MARTVWLAKFEPLAIDNVSGDVEQELWIASQHISVVNEQAGDPPSGVIDGLLLEPHSLSINALDANNMVATRSLPSLGDVTFGNPDGRFDEVLGWTFAQRQVTMWKGVEGEKLWRDPPLWSALCGEPTSERHEITVPTIGIEELLRRPLQVNRYTPGFEPSVILHTGGFDQWIDFGDNLDRGTNSFTFGLAFRTSAALHNGGLYTKKAGSPSGNTGYALRVTSTGSIQLLLSDGTDQVTIAHAPTGGYNSGLRISVVAAVNRTTDVATLFVNLNDGAGWSNVGTVNIVDGGGVPLGTFSNADILSAGSFNGANNFFDGEIERLVMRAGAGGPPIQEVQDALDEKFSEDVDASGFDHYVPMLENTGLTVGDLSPNSFDGTIKGPGLEANGNSSWSGLVNGTRDLDGVPKPKGFGWNYFVRPRLVDPVKHVYQYNDVDAGANSDVTNIGILDRGQVLQLEEVAAGDDIFTINLSGANEVLLDEDSGLVRVFPPGDDQPILAIKFRHAATADLKAGDAFSYVLNTLHGFSTFASVAPDRDVSFYWDGTRDIKIGEAVDEIATSIGASWSPRQRDSFSGGVPFFQLFSVVDPAGKTPNIEIRLTAPDDPIRDGELRVAEDGLRRVGVAPVFSAVNLEFARYHGFYSENELLEPNRPVDITPRDLQSEFREVRSDAPQAVLDRFINSEPLNRRTGISTAKVPMSPGLSDAAAQAQAEADRLIALHGQLVEVWECELTDERFEGWVGLIARVTGSLLTFETGREFLVVGVREGADDAGSTLLLWGPRPGTAPP